MSPLNVSTWVYPGDYIRWLSSTGDTDYFLSIGLHNTVSMADIYKVQKVILIGIGTFHIKQRRIIGV